jgi:hypothetical protein
MVFAATFAWHPYEEFGASQLPHCDLKFQPDFIRVRQRIEQIVNQFASMMIDLKLEFDSPCIFDFKACLDSVAVRLFEISPPRRELC